MLDFRSVLESSPEIVLSEDGSHILHQMYSEPDFDSLKESNSDIGKEDDDFSPRESTTEEWGDGFSCASDSSDKPWNQPENWDLPLEVTNPDLFEREEKLGDGYLQGFHQGARPKKRASEWFSQLRAVALLNQTVEEGQFDEDVDGGCEKLTLNSGVTGAGDCVKSSKGGDTDMTCDKNINKCVENEVLAILKSKHCYVPSVEQCRAAKVYSTSWIKPAMTAEPGQFDSD